MAACAAYATIKLNRPDISQKCVPKLECRGAPALRENRFQPPGRLVPLFNCLRKTKPAVTSIRKARPAVATCRAKIACTVLVVLVMAMVSMSERLCAARLIRCAESTSFTPQDADMALLRELQVCCHTSLINYALTMTDGFRQKQVHFDSSGQRNHRL